MESGRKAGRQGGREGGRRKREVSGLVNVLPLAQSLMQLFTQHVHSLILELCWALHPTSPHFTQLNSTPLHSTAWPIFWHHLVIPSPPLPSVKSVQNTSWNNCHMVQCGVEWIWQSLTPLYTLLTQAVDALSMDLLQINQHVDKASRMGVNKVECRTKLNSFMTPHTSVLRINTGWTASWVMPRRYRWPREVATTLRLHEIRYIGGRMN